MDLSPSRTGLLAQTLWRPPGSRTHCLLTCLDSSTTPGPAATRDRTRLADVAFPLTEKGRHPVACFRSSIILPASPLSTLRCDPSRDHRQDSRPEWSRFSFSVGLLHPLQCAGLSRRSLSPLFSSSGRGCAGHLYASRGSKRSGASQGRQSRIIFGGPEDRRVIPGVFARWKVSGVCVQRIRSGRSVCAVVSRAGRQVEDFDRWRQVPRLVTQHPRDIVPGRRRPHYGRQVHLARRYVQPRDTVCRGSHADPQNGPTSELRPVTRRQACSSSPAPPRSNPKARCTSRFYSISSTKFSGGFQWVSEVSCQFLASLKLARLCGNFVQAGQNPHAESSNQ